LIVGRLYSAAKGAWGSSPTGLGGDSSAAGGASSGGPVPLGSREATEWFESSRPDHFYLITDLIVGRLCSLFIAFRKYE